MAIENYSMIATFILLTGCMSLPDDMRGDVVAVNDRTVTIRGLADSSLGNFGNKPTPSPAMVKQAQEICPNAQFLSSKFVDESVALEMHAEYLFLCS